MRKRYRRRVVGYELRERLGQGGFAEVWRALQFTRGFSRDVCIKRARGFDGGVRRALAEEARADLGDELTERQGAGVRPVGRVTE